MQYSIVNGKKIEAEPNLTGLCICCNKPTYSACGKQIKWHWRHRNQKDCDPWWESETEWHREWKSNFPETWREVIQHDSQTGEKHIADVKTHKGVTLEFQNSPMNIGELKSRESFYKKMIWIINGAGFKNNVEFGYKLPDPTSNFPKNIKFLGFRHMIAYDKLKNPATANLVELIDKVGAESLTDLVEKYHTKHYTFEWKKIRRVWMQADMPVFIDFNEGILWRIMVKPEFYTGIICSHYSKKEFIKHYSN